MSRENVEVVRRLYTEWGRGNLLATEGLHPEIRVVLADATAAGVAETIGLAQLADALRQWLEPFQSVRLEAERIIEAGDQVVVISSWRGRGKGSGVETDWRLGTIWTFHNGLAVSAVASSPAEALQAAGLSE